MSMPHRTSSSESTDSIRKRVGKACDRCRLKKSKCDGSNPCSRCKADNTICVFGERKKSHDKVYPKGYVEMLEQQQAQLVAGLQETYRRLCAATAWPGAPLVEHSGHPLTHDILARLELLEPKHDGSGEMEVFEEDCKNLQNRLLSDGAPFVRRRGSFSSDSDHSHTQRHARHSSYSSARETPVPSKAQPIFEENWCFQPASPESSSQSPAPKSGSSRHSVKPSPLGTEAFKRDDYLPSHWLDVEPAADVFIRSQFAIQVPALHDGYQPLMDSYVQAMDLADLDNGNLAYSPHFSTQAQTSSMYGLQEWTNEPMDVDFSKFVQVST